MYKLYAGQRFMCNIIISHIDSLDRVSMINLCVCPIIDIIFDFIFGVLGIQEILMVHLICKSHIPIVLTPTKTYSRCYLLALILWIPQWAHPFGLVNDVQYEHHPGNPRLVWHPARLMKKRMCGSVYWYYSSKRSLGPFWILDSPSFSSFT